MAKGKKKSVVVEEIVKIANKEDVISCIKLKVDEKKLKEVSVSAELLNRVEVVCAELVHEKYNLLEIYKFLMLTREKMESILLRKIASNIVSEEVPFWTHEDLNFFANAETEYVPQAEVMMIQV